MYADSFGAVSQARDKVGSSVTWRLPKAFRLRQAAGSRDCPEVGSLVWAIDQNHSTIASI